MARRKNYKLDQSKQSNYSKKLCRLRKEQIAAKLAGQPAWKISPISAGYDRLWPLRDVAVSIGIPEDPAFSIPAGNDSRTSAQIAGLIFEKVKEISPDKMTHQRTKVVLKYYKKIFFTDVNHIFKFTSSQLLQLFFICMSNFTFSSNIKKSIYLYCTCKLDTQKRCPVVYAIHYDAQNNVYYVRPTKDITHTHDFDMAIERIKSIGYGLPVKDNGIRTTNISRRVNMLNRKARVGIQVDIPEDYRFSMKISQQMESKEIVLALKQLVNNVPMSKSIHPKIHYTYEKLLNITDEVYTFTCSQLCQILQVYQQCFRLDPTDDSYSTLCNCTPSMPGSRMNVGTCNFRWTLTTDYVKSQFYITFLAGKHNHGVEHCALKCGVDHEVFGISEVRPRLAIENGIKRTLAPQKRKCLRNRRTSQTFMLRLSLLEIANCAEPVDIPDDPSLDFEIDSSMGDKDFIERLKSKYFMRVRPDVVDSSIHKTFAKIFYIKHQIYRFTVSQLCQFFLAYKNSFWLRTAGPQKTIVHVLALCSVINEDGSNPKGCRSPCSLKIDREKQFIYWRKVGDPLVIQNHSHSFEEIIRKAGYDVKDLNLDLDSITEG
ncbi:unnamed protein product [Ambrosiozyma monospora]|uniref:Unnamed protein product n=1 Tax=Ambrosiozyma monospora TaxID=43982 RepID=A0A9W6YPQ7_AMBMO|nr:unnamed protein product [Ambrosiozyma monospora]